MKKIIISETLIATQNINDLLSCCPFSAIDATQDGKINLNANCKICGICAKKFPTIFTIEEIESISIDKSQWQGVAVVAEFTAGQLHPVSLELLGKARELASKIGQKVLAVAIGYNLAHAAEMLRKYGADEVALYDHQELENFRIEPYTAALEDFINNTKPAVVLVGGTSTGRNLAPRTAARFRTGLTADCTILDIKPNSDLEQIRPAFGGNIMAHINTPNHRPQFATVRYKIFPMPQPVENPTGVIKNYSLEAEKLSSAIKVIERNLKPAEINLEDAEVIIAVGRGLKKVEDMNMIEELAKLLHARIAGTRCLTEAGWVDHKCQIGLSGRTVAPKLIICCGISGAVQFAAGMKGAEKIVAINSDANAPIFSLAHIGIVGDMYEIVPQLLQLIKQGGTL